MRRAFLATFALLTACRTHARESERSRDAAVAPVPSSAAAVVDAAAPGLPPLDAPWIEKLSLPDGGIAFVAPPVGAREPRPIIVGVHGAWDDPGLMCSAWRLIADAYAFVVCPSGRPVDDHRYVWSSGDQLAKRVRDAVAVAKARHAAYVAGDAPMIYVAFSQGANLAGPLLAHDARAFPRVVFTEGGYRTFEDAAVARAFAKGGGERVLFTCSQPGCPSAFAASSARLAGEKIATRVDYSGPHGHSMPPAVRARIHALLPWIVEDLRGWEGYAAAPKLDGN